MDEDFNEHIKRIKGHLNNLRLYELEENKKDIVFNIKQLPNELINYVFSYISLIPFDKEDFNNYYKENKLEYIFRNTLHQSAFIDLPNTPYNCNKQYLLGYRKDNTRDRHNIYGSNLRLTDDIYTFEFNSWNTQQHKSKIKRGYKTREYTRFLSFNKFQYQLGKEDLILYVKENISKRDLVLLSNKINYKRMNKQYIIDLIIRYTLSFY